MKTLGDEPIIIDEEEPQTPDEKKAGIDLALSFKNPLKRNTGKEETETGVDEEE